MAQFTEQGLATSIDPGIALTSDEVRRIVGATRAAKQRRGWAIDQGHQFFLFDGFARTSFRKASPGGIMGHRYFDLAEVLGGRVPSALEDFAEALRGVTWE